MCAAGAGRTHKKIKSPDAKYQTPYTLRADQAVAASYHPTIGLSNTLLLDVSTIFTLFSVNAAGLNRKPLTSIANMDLILI